MISLSAMVSVVITIIVAGLIFGLLWWLVGYCGLPQPFDKVARVVLAILAVLVLIGLLLQVATGQSVFKARGTPPMMSKDVTALARQSPPDEVLIPDPRSGLTPSDRVSQKLAFILGKDGQSVPHGLIPTPVRKVT